MLVEAYSHCLLLSLPSCVFLFLKYLAVYVASGGVGVENIEMLFWDLWFDLVPCLTVVLLFVTYHPEQPGRGEFLVFWWWFFTMWTC